MRDTVNAIAVLRGEYGKDWIYYGDDEQPVFDFSEVAIEHNLCLARN